MLSDERTTHEELPAPREVEGLVVAPGRVVMRSLVGYLRGEGINVRTVADAEGAFEEALLRTRALYRRIDRLQRTQRSEIVDRRQWLSHFLHDLKGQIGALAANVEYLARFAPDASDERRGEFDASIDDTRGIFDEGRG